ncbi:MAG: MATE family efflux transporter [Eubacteriales bacterium]|nr:MATE family efflux transporter [Eubacteriales bacterium]
MTGNKNEGIKKSFVKYTSLNVLGMLGLSCYILADTYFISKGLGAEGLAALNLAIPIYSFIHGMGLMLGMGGATRCSILRGQKEQKRADSYFTSCVRTALGIGVILVLFGLLASRGITAALGAEGNVFDMTNTYLKVILLFSPMFLMNNVLLCFVRNDGKPRLAMAAMLSGSFSNIILDYIFIFPLRMGIFGAVLATGFAPVISIGVMSICFFRKDYSFRIDRSRPSVRRVADVCSLGLPSLVTEVSSGIVMIVFNMIILGLMGNTGVAAYGVIANLSLVIMSMFNGVAQGIQPIISNSYGYGKREDVKRVLRYALVTVIAASVLIYIGIFVWADPVAMVFNSGRDVILQDTAVYGLRIYFAACPFAGVNVIMAVYFASVDKPKPSHYISLMRGFFLILPLTFLLSATLGMTGVWMAFPAAEFLCCIFAVFCHRRYIIKKQ